MDDGDGEGTWTVPIPIQQPEADRPRGATELERLMPPRNESLEWRGPIGADSPSASANEQTGHDSASGLRPGTIFAILLALAALILYFWVPLLGIIIGAVAAVNAVIAARLWLGLGER